MRSEDPRDEAAGIFRSHFHLTIRAGKTTEHTEGICLSAHHHHPSTRARNVTERWIRFSATATSMKQFSICGRSGVSGGEWSKCGTFVFWHVQNVLLALLSVPLNSLFRNGTLFWPAKWIGLVERVKTGKEKKKKQTTYTLARQCSKESKKMARKLVLCRSPKSEEQKRKNGLSETGAPVMARKQHLGYRRSFQALARYTGSRIWQANVVLSRNTYASTYFLRSQPLHGSSSEGAAWRSTPGDILIRDGKSGAFVATRNVCSSCATSNVLVVTSRLTPFNLVHQYCSIFAQCRCR